MTKAEIVNEIASNTKVERADVLKTVEAFMKIVKGSLKDGENVYLRGFGTFGVKFRAEKVARNISQNSTVIVPAHHIPSFKASKTFAEEVKNSNGKS